jgi:hypothetical protein
MQMSAATSMAAGSVSFRFSCASRSRAKQAENHNHMMSIYFTHYNFVRIHQTLKVTPAMAANVTPKRWKMADMVKVLEDWDVAGHD